MLLQYFNVQCIFNDSSLLRKFEETKVHFLEISKARKVRYFEISKEFAARKVRYFEISKEFTSFRRIFFEISH